MGDRTASVLNGTFDRTVPYRRSVHVIGKRSVVSKSAGYYLALDWTPSSNPEVEVPERVYRSVQPGSAMTLSVHSGALRCPWMTLTSEP